MLSLTVAIPAFNEQATLEKVSREAISAAAKITSNFELLLVNDGSTDQTAQIMEKLAQKDQHVKVIHHQKNQGFSGAITTSLKKAAKKLVLLAPADGQFDFNQLPDFVRAINGYDVVLGFRIINHESINRKIQSWFFHNLCKILLGIPIKEIPTISLWRKSVLDHLTISVNPRSNMVLPEIIYQLYIEGYKFVQIPIIWYPRRGGVAKGSINPFLIFSTLIEMVKLYLKTR